MTVLAKHIAFAGVIGVLNFLVPSHVAANWSLRDEELYQQLVRDLYTSLT